MAGNVNNDIFLNSFGNLKSVFRGDVNQNFEQTKLYQAGMRGLNNNKASPDSGWTFPGLVAPQLFPGFISQPGTNNVIMNGNANHVMPDLNSFNADFRAHTNNVNRNSHYPQLLPETYQTKVLAPLMEMNIRQQQHHQQMLETAMLSQSNNAYNLMSIKGYDNQNSHVTNQNTASFATSSSSTNCNLMAMNLKPSVVNSGEHFGKTLNQRMLWNDRRTGSNLTPAVTPVEGKHLQESLMQPYFGMNQTPYDSSQMQSALAASQLHNYLSLLRQTQMNVRKCEKQEVTGLNGAVNVGIKLQNGIPTTGTLPNNVGCIANTVVLTPGSVPSGMLAPGNIPNTVLTPILTPGVTPNSMLSGVILPNSEMCDKNSNIDASTKMDEKLKIPLHVTTTSYDAGGNAHKHVATANSQLSIPSYRYDTRAYQASSSSSLTSSTSPQDVLVTDYNRPSKSSPHPQRPKHLGSDFIPHTQFLSVNVSHGTPSSDRESVHSLSISPNHTSPYSTSGQRSRTPSPRIDKIRTKNDNGCSQCGKQFSSSSALAKHKLIHSDERKYVCHICSRGFKRQDHLNGHMITHRDKKPYECHYPDCEKSYCDMRSLRRHLENHHSSPPGGVTPAGYMPKLMSLYPVYSEENSKAHLYRMAQPHEQDTSRLGVPNEIPRPSSAPLVPPEPKRVTRTRRSSSGEESGIQLDPAMVRELEMRMAHPYFRHDRGISDDFTKKSNDKRIEISRNISSAPTLSKSLPVSSHTANAEYAPRIDYTKKYHLMEFERREHERHLNESKQPEFSRHQLHRESKQTHSAERLYKDYENNIKKQEFSPPGLPHGAYPAGIASQVMNPKFPWGAQFPQPGPSPGSANMPFLLNIRNPFSFPQHGFYQNQKDTPSTENIEISKTEHEARQQAMNTYYQMWANGQHGNLTPEQLFMHQRSMLSGQNIPTPTDAAAIAIAAAKEPSEKSTFKTRDDLYGIHPANAQWQQVMQDDSVTREKEASKPTFYPHASLSTSHESGYIKRPPSRESVHRYPPQERNIIDEPFKPSESNHRDHYRYTPSPKSHYYERNRPIEQHINHQNRTATYDTSPRERVEQARFLEQSRHLDVSHSPVRYDSHNTTPHREHAAKLYESSFLHVETPENNVASTMSPNKKRPRPGPIIIPPAVNNRALQNSLSPMKNFPRGIIYTPPAMLSQTSIFFNPPGLVSRVATVPGTPARLSLIRRNSSIDQRETPLKPSVSVSSDDQGVPEIPEPKINVGAQFQAVLPNVCDRSEAQKDIHRASLMWSPLKEDEYKNVEVKAYLEMACSLGLYGGSNNKEYALHILQRTRGNVKEAVRLLLSRRHILRADDPNADYHYSGSVRWTAKERLAFRQAYRTKGKVFIDIQREVVTKSVQLCVEFYYQWKAMHPESFRARTRMVEVESEQDDEEVPPTPTAAVAPLSTLREPVFECDYPECRARFVSRQALNGHIRVHGGSFSKPLDTRRSKPKSLISPDMESMSMPSPPKKKRPTAPSSVIVTNTTDGPQVQFQCKVCGRVFGKVKSRSAHMKTHVKRDDNNKPIKKQKPTKQKQPPQPPPHPMTVFAHA